MVRETGSNRPKSPDSSGLWRMAGLGTELAGGIVGFVLLGWWIDRKFGTSPTWLIVGSVLGGVGGMVHLIKRAIAFQRDDQASRKAASEKRASASDADKGRDDTFASS